MAGEVMHDKDLANGLDQGRGRFVTEASAILVNDRQGPGQKPIHFQAQLTASDNPKLADQALAKVG